MTWEEKRIQELEKEVLRLAYALIERGGSTRP